MSVADLELRPGQSVKVICEGKTSTPFGEKTHETFVTITYDELIQRFKTQTSKRTTDDAKAFSRHCSLIGTAVKTGKWRTGAAVDRNEVVKDLVKKFANLKEDMHVKVSSNGVSHLETILQNKSLKNEVKAELKSVLDTIKKAQG